MSSNVENPNTTLRDSSGTEVGTDTDPIRVDPTGTTTQPVSQGTAAASSAPWSVRQSDGTSFINPALEHVTSASPHSVRLSDGTSFYVTPSAAQLPSSLVGGRLDINVGTWIGSTAPTIGQKLMSSSIPVVIASDQTLSVSATSASIGVNQSAAPTSSTLIGASDGTNLREARSFDLDTGAGTDYNLGVSIRLPASGGSVSGGTFNNPIRVDPTGTTPQPVSTSDVVATGSISANGVTITSAPLAGQGSVAIQINGVWVGTIQLEASVDGTNFFALAARGVSSFLIVNNVTTNGAWRAGIAGFHSIRVRSSAWTSGTATITIRESTGTTPIVLAEALPSGANTIGTVLGSGNFITVGPGAVGAAVSGNPIRIGASDGTNTRNVLSDTSGRLLVSGAAATGAAVTGNPVLVGGQDGTNARALRTDTTGRVLVVGAGIAGAAVAGDPLLIGGSDGANAQFVKVDTSGRITTVGAGTAGTPTGGVLTVQGVSGGTVIPVDGSAVTQPVALSTWIGSSAPTVGQKTSANSLPVVISSDQSAIPISGSVTATNPSVSTTGTAVPASATMAGGSDGTNLRALRTATDGTLRIDPTGTTTQPVSGTVAVSSVGGTVDIGDRAARLVGVVYGSQGQQLKQTAVDFNLQTEVAVGGTLIDPRSIRALTPSDVVSAKTEVQLDYDTGVGTQNLSVIGIGLPASGGTVAGGTSTNPIRVDPTGTTPQPISGTVTAAQGAAAVATAPWSVRQSDGTSFINPALEHVTAGSPHSVRLSDGSAFYTAPAAAQLPSSLVGGRLDTNIGTWLGSNAPTVGSKTSANSIPVVIASDQGAIPVTIAAGTDRTSTGTITSTQNVAISTQSSGSCGVQVTGTWAGTLVFEATVDGTNWSSVDATVSVGGSDVTSTTNNGVWLVACAGFSQVRVRGNSVSSGTATVFLEASTASQVVTLGDPLPSGSNTIGAVTSVQLPTTLGQKTMANSLAVVLASDQAAIPVTISGSATDRTSTGTITSTQNVAINTQASGTCGVQITGTWTGTLAFEASVDGTNWNSIDAIVPTTGAEVTSTTANGVWSIACAGFQQVRVRGNSIASGTATIYLNASTGTQVVTVSDPLPTGSNTIGAVTQAGAWITDVSDRAGRLVGVVYGSQGQQIKQTASNFNLQVELATGGTLYDGRQVRALTSADVVTSNQGAPNTLANRWPVQVTDGTNTMPTGDVAARGLFHRITDGTNTATVKAGSTAAAAGDSAVVVAVSPNNTVTVSAVSLPLPTGAATEATLTSRLADSTFTSRINTQGQKAMTGSTPVVIASDQSAVPVSGTVTANLGTVANLALDATLTGGSAKSVVRGGVKGVTTASDVTSTAEGTDHQALDVQLYHGGSAVNPAQIRALTSSDVVTAAQGAAAVATAPWSVRQSDGTSFINPALEHVTAGSPHSVRLSDGSAFYTAPAAAQLPSSLVGGRLDTNIGTWLGSNAPTVGSKTSANSIPVVIASDQGAINLKTEVQLDYDLGAGTQNLSMHGIALPAVGGAVAGGTATNPIRVDPTGTSIQPISGTVTTNQGTAAALSGYWPVRITDGTNTMPTADTVARAVFHKLTDGTNTATVKAASTAPLATDPALVVAMSPNASVTVAQPTAANFNATAAQGDPGTSANAWFQKLTDGTNTAAVKGASTAAVGADPALVVTQSPNRPADPVVTGNLGALNTTVQISCAGNQTLGGSITGTWVGVITAEGTVNGTNWFTVRTANKSTNDIIQTYTNNDNFEFYAVAGCTAVRLRMSSYISGSAQITLAGTSVATDALLNYSGPDGDLIPPTRFVGFASLSLDGTLHSPRNSNTDPTGTEYALLTRNIPSGTQTVGGIETTSYSPDPSAVWGPSVGLTLDASDRLETHSTVTADEGSLRDDFSGSTLTTALTGTLNWTNGSTTVTGSGTSFTTQIKSGQYIKKTADAETAYVQVSSVDSDTDLTLVSGYAGTTASGVASVVSTWLTVTAATGGSITVGSSLVNIVSGTANAQSSSISREGDYPPFTCQIYASISQRIANQTAWLGFRNNLTAPSKQACVVFTGTTNTQVNFVTSFSSAAADTQTTTVTLPNGATTATTRFYKIDLSGNQATLSIDGVVLATHSLHIPGPYDNMSITAGTLNSAAVTATTLSVDLIYFYNNNRVQIDSDYQGEPLIVGAQADDVATGSITATAQNLVFTTPSARSTYSFQIAGTWTGVINFEKSNDGTNWVTMAVYDGASSNTLNSVTANGIFYTSAGAKPFVRLRSSGTWTGTATATLIKSCGTSGITVIDSLPTGTNTIGRILSKSAPQYGTANQALTITLASLSNNASRASTFVDNTTNLFDDALIFIKVTSANSGTSATGYVNVYGYATVDGGTTYSENVTGTDAAITLVNPTNLMLLAQINVVANNVTYRAGPFSFCRMYGLDQLPARWGVVVTNASGATLNATGSNHGITWQGINRQLI